MADNNNNKMEIDEMRIAYKLNNHNFVTVRTVLALQQLNDFRN